MSDRRDRLEGLSTFLLLAALVVVLGLLAATGSETLQRTAIESLLLVTAVVGFYVFVGNSGILSFGHVCFMSIGAYVGGLLAINPIDRQTILFELPSWLANIESPPPYVACLAGGLVAAAVAAFVSIAIMRLNGIAAALTSFAVLQIVYVVERNWNQVTNGSSGIDGIPTTTTVGSALVTAVAAIALALLFQRTRWGARLRASREDEVAAHALGIGVLFERRLAFALSAFVVGTAGGLYGQFLGSITPDTLYLNTTFLLVVMLIVGGQTSLSGAVVGAIFVSVVREGLRQIEAGAQVGPVFLDGPLGLAEVGLALVLLVALILRPAGLTGGRELTMVRPLERLLGRGRPSSPEPAPPVEVPEPPPAVVEERRS